MITVINRLPVKEGIAVDIVKRFAKLGKLARGSDSSAAPQEINHFPIRGF
jgi:hypothetical protein